MAEPAALKLAERADALQDALPSLLVEAERVAATLLQGVHGRKRAGPGETFWQYRPYGFGDSTQRIDWRKSARSSHVFIRENEWEAANTLWLWANPSPGMDFKSHLSEVTKRDRAYVMALALATLALRAHERVALIGAPERPSHARSAVLGMARRLLLNQGQGLPDAHGLHRHAAAVLFGDFLEPIPEIERAVRGLAAQGISGHIVQINDPAEEALPYEGRIEFLGLDNPLKYLANRTEELRTAYGEKFRAHRGALRMLARSVGWSFAAHHTDQPPGALLMALHGRISERAR
jgi:uncharacterized protein (DUF58 family)